MGDAWDKTDMESPPSAPVTNTQPIEPLINEEEDQPQGLDLLPNPLPLEPPHQEHPLPDLPAQPRRRRTELELLGDPPIIEGPRPRHLPERYRVDSPPPEAEVLLNDGDADDDALAQIAFVFAASATSTGYTDPMMLSEAMDSPDADSWRQAIEVEVKSLQAMGTFVIVEKLPPG